MRDNGTLYWLLGDHLGRTAYKVYATTEIGEMHYLPWGGTRFTSGQTVTSYKFTVQREEASLGLYDYGARDGTIPIYGGLSKTTADSRQYRIDPKSDGIGWVYRFWLNRPIKSLLGVIRCCLESAVVFLTYRH